MEKSCGAIVFRIIEGEIQYLGVRSQENGHWGFPKGHVEDGESETETALREIKEETGLEVEFIQGYRESIKYSLGNNIDKTVIFFIGKAQGEKVKTQEEEISEYVWLNYREMMELIPFDNAREILEKANDFLKK